MMSRIRPLLRRLESVGFATLAATLIAGVSVACSASDESSAPNSARAGAVAEAPSEPENVTACSPDVDGLVPARIEPIEIDCPHGYAERKSFAALPIAGRFTTLTELTGAFCVEKIMTGSDATYPRLPTSSVPIDFTTSDVVAYVFDRRAGSAPALFAGRADLWLKVTTSACGGEAPDLASIAFVVPKEKRINEQKCSLACE